MTINRESVSKNKDWNTPPEYIKLILNVFGYIDLDPCSNDYSTVPATFHFNKENNGLNKDWSFARTIFVNPPYGRNLDKTTIKDWINKCLEANNTGSEVIALIPVATNTKHWEIIFYSAAAICFIRTPRIKFYYNGEIVKKGAPMACAFIYWGNRPDRFRDNFSRLGKVIVCL